MLIGVALAILVVMSLALARAVAGPLVFDRILALNVFGTKTVLLIAVMGFVLEQPAFLLDIALTYAMINFIGVIGVLRYVEYSIHEQSAQAEEQ